MTDDLTEIEERLRHCWMELGRFNQSTMEFANHGFSSRWEEAGPIVHAYATMLKPIPTALRSQAGMILNEVRACLDGLACTLARRNGETKTRDTYFPISKSKEIFEKDGMKKIKSLSEADRNRIISLSPYQGGNNRLWNLHEADRIRKHTGLIMSGGAAGGMGFGNGTMDCSMIINTAPPMFEKIGKEHKVAEIFHQGTASISIIFGLRYSEPPLAGARVEMVIEDSISVACEVIDMFR